MNLIGDIKGATEDIGMARGDLSERVEELSEAAKEVEISLSAASITLSGFNVDEVEELLKGLRRLESLCEDTEQVLQDLGSLL